MVLGVGDHRHQHEGGVTQEVEWEEHLLYLCEHVTRHRQEKRQTWGRGRQRSLNIVFWGEYTRKKNNNVHSADTV